MNNVEIKKIPSMNPYYIACIVGVVLSFILPMYKISSYLIVIGVSLVVLGLLIYFKVFKDDEIEVPVKYATSELEELVLLANSQIQALDQLLLDINHNHIKQLTSSIKQTSELILNYTIKNEKIEKDVRKFFRYYLDEVVNMVRTYEEYEDHEVSITHMNESKEKIEKTLIKADQAFQSFYNDLYAGEAMDVSVDLNVFESMLQQIK